jgi:DNA-binding LacI/PurR family transcriptional regulator
MTANGPLRSARGGDPSPPTRCRLIARAIADRLIFSLHGSRLFSMPYSLRFRNNMALAMISVAAAVATRVLFGMNDAPPSDPPHRATSYDVARLAGVSQSAVSRCFRERGSISAEMRARIEAAAAALGYAPNKIARSLMTQRSNIIGVLMGDVTTRNYPDLLMELAESIQHAGRRMLLFTLTGSRSAATALPDVLAYHLDGLIAGVSLPDDMLRSCAQRQIPVVLYNRPSRDGCASSIGCDDPAALAALAAHLREGGSRRVACVAGPEEAPVSQSRLRAMQDAADVHGLDICAVVHADYGYDGGRRAAASLCDHPARPDTIVCANDAMALGAIDACRFDRRLRVPDDVAVAGYDNVPEGAWPPYRLTTLAQPIEEMTRAAVRMVLEQLDATAVRGEQRLMPATLVVRNSTRPTMAKPSDAARSPLQAVPADRTVRP